MYDLCALMGLTFINEYKTYAYESGYFVKGAQAHIDDAIKLVLLKIRPQAIPLIEMNGYSDAYLVSAIGNSYGDIYETHIEWA